MNNETFLKCVTNENYLMVLTICGSYRFRELKEKYQAYYSLKNNMVFLPINYMSIKHEVEDTHENNRKVMANIHDRKILLSSGIIVVTGIDGYFGSDTAREIQYAKDNDKRILFTTIPEDTKEKYYFNNDETYPLYMLKEEYL